MENFGSAAQLFPASRFSCWVYEKLGGLSFLVVWLSQLSQLLPNFQNFPAYGSAFPAATAAPAAAFPAFWRRSSRIATGAAAQVGMASSWNRAIGKIWKDCHLLDELSNSGKT